MPTLAAFSHVSNPGGVVVKTDVLSVMPHDCRIATVGNRLLSFLMTCSESGAAPVSNCSTWDRS